MKSDSPNELGSRLMKAVEAIAISPKDARALVANYRKKVGVAEGEKVSHEQRALIADHLIARYAKFAATSGGATALAGVIPGLGTVVTMLGGATADIAVVIKLQADLCLCIADAFEYDIDDPTARHLAYMISLGATLNQAGVGIGTQVASKAGVKMIREYLKGATLQFIKQLFAKVGLVFSRKSLEKALPFGIGVAFGITANYHLVKYVGRQAKQWFMIDAETE